MAVYGGNDDDKPVGGGGCDYRYLRSRDSLPQRYLGIWCIYKGVLD